MVCAQFSVDVYCRMGTAINKRVTVYTRCLFLLLVRMLFVWLVRVRVLAGRIICEYNIASGLVPPTFLLRPFLLSGILGTVNFSLRAL